MYDWINIWQVVLEGIMTLGLPMLHGYSRMEYEKITGKMHLKQTFLRQI